MSQSTKQNITKVKFLIIVLQIVYPRFNPIVFLTYMFLNYAEMIKRKGIYQLKPVSEQTFKSLLSHETYDPNNTIILPTFLLKLLPGDLGRITIDLNGVTQPRYVYVVAKTMPNCTEIVLSRNLFHNLKNKCACKVEKIRNCPVKIATELELSLVSSPNELSNFIVDEIVKSYFKTPKLVHPEDILEVSLSEFGRDVFFSTSKITNLNDKAYFKCNKVTVEDQSVNCACLCVFGKTTVKQSSNIQSFISSHFCSERMDFGECPSGLEKYFQDLKKSAAPFITSQRKQPQFLPSFLIEGAKGCGKSILVKSLASWFGMHLLTTTNFDVSANVFAQYETKLRNLFFAAKMTAPVIIEIRNFENFGKNNEGAYDERLIENFQTELTNLFVKNEWPIILFCTANSPTVPATLKRLFLKIFQVKSPDERQRESMLDWILNSFQVNYSFALDEIANKTQGFLFEDVRALIELALVESRKEAAELTDKHILETLDRMQANYNDSLGAPKVPKIHWEDIGGLNDVKDEIIKTIKLPFKHPGLLTNNALKRTGILLYGPPGTGKTLLAKAVANECGMCFLSIKGPELLNMYVGQSEQNVREVFERAREASPCVIFFDELDSLAPNRGASGDSGGVMDRVVSQLLAEMDGLNECKTIFIIGATNRPDLIDPALLRPGRFDKLVFVGPCSDNESKLAVFNAITRKFCLECRGEDVVDLCPDNFTGADFYGVCSNAWLSAAGRLIDDIESDKSENASNASQENVVVTLDDFRAAIENVKPSMRQEDLVYFNRLKAEMS